MWGQQEDSLTDSILARVPQGVSIRGYAETLEGELNSFGTSKSRVAVRFYPADANGFEERLHQRLDEQVFVALRVDGSHRGDHTVQVTLGVTADGPRPVLGLQEGATEHGTGALCPGLDGAQVAGCVPRTR
ncbi:MAG: transposase [Firmicutes bacterium]|nr:transposase [Bacillota bacterium]